MERLDFSSLWMNERWSDVTLVIRPRARCEEASRVSEDEPGPSTPASSRAESKRRFTRSMVKGMAATPGRQTSSVQTASPALPNGGGSQSLGRRKAAQRSTSPPWGTVKASRGMYCSPTKEEKLNGASVKQQSAIAQGASPGPSAPISATNLPESPIIYPAHAAVLISTSEYFKRYFDAWHPEGGSKVVTLEVEPEEVEAASLMLRYMYTGELPSPQADPAQLLHMIKLADQYSVNRFLSTCNSALSRVPLESLTLSHVASILALPPFLLEEGGGALAVARRRAEEKLVALFGDLEGAWFDPGRRQEFLRLPLTAVRFLMARTETAVYNENTVLVALTDWIAQHNAVAAAAAAAASIPTTAAAITTATQPAGTATGACAGGSGSMAPATTTPMNGGEAAAATAAAAAGGLPPPGGPSARQQAAQLATGATSSGGTAITGGGGVSSSAMPQPLSEAQLDELFALVRLAHLSSAYMALLPYIGWVRRRLTPQLLSRVLQLVKAEAVAPGGAAAAGGGGGLRTGGDRMLYGNGALELLQRMMGQTAVPRAVPERTALELEWTIHRSDVQALIAECRSEDCAACPRGAGGPGGSGGHHTGSGGGRCSCASVESTRLFSEPAYYYAGFYWRMCFFVHKKVEPKRRRLGDPLANLGAGAGAGVAGGGGGGGGGEGPLLPDVRGGSGGGGGGGCACGLAVYHDFLGVTCNAVLGGEEFAPLAAMDLELAACRFSALGEELPPQRAEVPGYVDDEVPYGVYDFFRQDNLTDASQLEQFTCRRNMLHLSCKITRCS